MGKAVVNCGRSLGPPHVDFMKYIAVIYLPFKHLSRHHLPRTGLNILAAIASVVRNIFIVFRTIALVLFPVHLCFSYLLKKNSLGDI